jgi:surface polysaccharide O-acyltransferase-like enzyme
MTADLLMITQGPRVEVREPSKRAVELDVLRGAGALAVIVLHASASPLAEQSSAGQVSWMLLVPNVMARFAVPVFVILSGMSLTLSARSDESYPRFLWRRLFSIVPAYILWSLVYTWLLPRHGSISVRSVLADLITGHASSHLYFVPTIVRLYLLYPVMRYLARSFWGVLGCCALSLSMLWLSAMLTSTPFGTLVDELLPLRWIGYFVLGIWLATVGLTNAPAATSRGNEAATRALARAQTLAPAFATLSLGCMIAIVQRVTEQSTDIDVALGVAEPLIFPYSVSILLWSTSVAFGADRITRFLTFVSDHSYSVYLSHVLILHLCALILQAFAPEGTHLMLFSLGLVLGIPLALWTAVISARAKRALRPAIAPVR